MAGVYKPPVVRAAQPRIMKVRRVSRLPFRRLFSNVRDGMISPEKSCCFTGHRPKYFRFGTNENDPDCVRIKGFIQDKCEYLITEKKVIHFISGGAVGVDTWAMEIVIGLKEKYREIRLELALPYEGMMERFAVASRKRYANIAPQLDKITVLNMRYHAGCMQQRNEYMVAQAAYLIAVWTGAKSGTGNTVRYAKERRRTVFILNPDSPAAPD